MENSTTQVSSAKETTLCFIKPGMQSLVVGPQRLSHLDHGVSFGGPADRKAHRDANAIVGNRPSQPSLEIALMGPTITFHGAPCTIAITGAATQIKLHGKPASLYTQLRIDDGDILKFMAPSKGFRSYLAVSGEWRVDNWLGSCTAFNKQFTPLAFIRQGSELTIQQEKIMSPGISTVSPMGFDNHLLLTVTKGPEFDILSNSKTDLICSRPLTVAPNSNRTGIRFSTRIEGLNHSYDMVSSGIIPGTIQLTPDGDLIILFVDAQTTGGYPRIGVVKDIQLDSLAQLRPGDEVSIAFD